MKERVINIRVIFVAFVGLMVGILFSLYNTFDNFKLWKIILFFFIILLISVALFLYGKFTMSKNILIRSRRQVSYLLMSSGVAFLIFVVVGFLITLMPYFKVTSVTTYSQPIRVEGVVSDYVNNESTYTKFVLSDCVIENNGEVYECDFDICVYADMYTDVVLGDLVLLDSCELTNYNYNKSTDLIKLSQGVGYQTYINSSNIKISSGKPILRDVIKNKVHDLLSDNLNEDNSSVMFAMLFGEKFGLSENITDSFSYAGISHVLAVSGLHVGILAAAILFILKKIKMNKYLRVVILSFVLLFYAYLCSYSPSVCRASIMTIIMAICDAMMIENDGLSSLSIAGIIILLFSPLSILSLSFQLSFLSVFAIISFAPAISKLFKKIKLPRFIADTFAISIATNLAILPVCATAFTKVSLLGVFTNFLVIPLFTVNYILAFFIVLFACMFSFVGKLLILPNLFLHLIKFIADISTRVDGLVFKTFQNSYLIIFFLCVGILLLHYLMSKKLIKLCIILPLIITSIIQFSIANIEYSSVNNAVIFSHQYKSNVVFYLKDNEVTMIGSNIDCDSLLYCMKQLKIRKIDNVVAYDFQLNQMDNTNRILKDFEVESFYIPDRFNYSEISQMLNCEKYYKDNLVIKDLNIKDIKYQDQIIGIYLNIFEIGDILIPEIKPTKKESSYLIDNYKNAKYYYQPTITENMKSITADCVITNSDGDISLGGLNAVVIDKEFSYNEI